MDSTSSTEYLALAKNEVEAEDISSHQYYQKRRPRVTLLLTISVCMNVLALVIVGIIVSFERNGSIPHNSSDLTKSPLRSRCVDPPLRREWSTISAEDRSAYIAAVKCLQTIPSRISRANNIWDDFPYTHVRQNQIVHGGEHFLAYHRWFIHLYEKVLREDCKYQGHLVYWDWNLNWKDPYNASVFDPDTGFGGDGDPEKPGYLGHCIKDGPFANHMVSFENDRRKTHCLSRQFATGQELQHWQQKWRPEEVNAVLEIEESPEFMEALESGMHLAMPYLIGGDMQNFGSPSDPLFFLHHTQLDRIYWKWQQRRPQDRIFGLADQEASGKNARFENITADISFDGLGSIVSVGDIMNIQGDFLCYRYE